MSENQIWPEIQKAFETKRYELVLVGDEISKRIEDSEGKLDKNLFKLKNLNFLEIAKTNLSFLPPEISKIENLTSLLCHSNQLTKIPVELGLLINLKNLDLSNNKLSYLPTELSNLKELMTLNLGGNELNSLFPLAGLTKLAVLDINRNKFTELPQDLGSESLENLSQINASFNQLTELSDNLAELPSLKLFNLENNSLAHVPSALSQCNKLKDLLLKENKLKDNRLKKLVDQEKSKPILDYLARLYEEELKKKPKNDSKKNNSKKNKSDKNIQEFDLIKILHFQDEKFKSKELVLSDSALSLRPYILCAILRGIDLETPGNLKKFLSIQTKLHEEECQKRTLATIATHDLNNIIDKIFYEAADPDNIELVPLGRKYPVYANDYYLKLMEEAENERKQKKRNQLSGIYKYLTLLDKQTKFCYVRDSESVISLPPLTNAEKTKMSVNTKDIFVEISSNESLEICKAVMEKMFLNMLQAGLASKVDLESQVETLNLEENRTPKNTLLIQQVKIQDSIGNLKLVYPSRLDLNSPDLGDKIKVLRLYDD